MQQSAGPTCSLRLVQARCLLLSLSGISLLGCDGPFLAPPSSTIVVVCPYPCGARDMSPKPAADMSSSAPNGRFVFITKNPYKGSDLWAPQADTFCQENARASKLEAVRAGHYWKAWLSYNRGNRYPEDGYAKALLKDALKTAGVNPDGDTPWFSTNPTDTEPLFYNADATATTPNLPLRYDQDGTLIPDGTRIWTGTRVGAIAPVTALCPDKTYVSWNDTTGNEMGLYGEVGRKDARWTEAGAQRCDAMAPIVCFQVY